MITDDLYSVSMHTPLCVKCFELIKPCYGHCTIEVLCIIIIIIIRIYSFARIVCC